MTDPARVERSRQRNRARGISAEAVRRMATIDVDKEAELRAQRAGPRFQHRADLNGNLGSMHDAWGGPTPPEAA